MAFFYSHAVRPSLLFPELHALIKAERGKLKPQTPQTIIVGNLDTEAWLQRQFLAQDAVLMGVDFPFLESALDNFAVRIFDNEIPLATENWFSEIKRKGERKKQAGMLELELVLLELIQDPQHSKLFASLGYDPAALTAMKQVALAVLLAEKIREYLLHVPQIMRNFLKPSGTKKAPADGIGGLWHLTAACLTAKKQSALLFNPSELFERLKKPVLTPAHETSALFLFGMPVLSAYHVQVLAAISCVVDVHLLAVDLAGETTFNPQVGQKFQAYRNVLQQAAKSAKAEFRIREITAGNEKITPPEIEFWGLPGAWRGAELIADRWHELLKADRLLRQDDISVAVHDFQGNFAAFEKACGMRNLAAYSRSKIYERPHAMVELLGIAATASLSGLNRELIVEYLENPVVKQTFALDGDKVALFIRALETAQGFRSDFSGAQKVFNIDEAIKRLLCGFVLDPDSDTDNRLPAAGYIREFDSAENTGDFIRLIAALAGGSAILSNQKGSRLFLAVSDFFERSLFARHETYPAFRDIVQKIAGITEEGAITLPQLVQILGRHLPGKSLAQGSQKEGITLSPLSGPCFVKPHLTLFDLNEDLKSGEDEADVLLPEYTDAPTRLAPAEQLAIAVQSAMLSQCRTILFAWSNLEPASGAEKYLSHEMQNVKATLAKQKVPFRDRTGFPATMLAPVTEEIPPLASTHDARTAALVAQGYRRQDGKLSTLLLPAVAITGEKTQVSVRDLTAYLTNPARYLLGQTTILPEEPDAFRREEPRLAVSSSARFKFCEDYLLDALQNAAAISTPEPLQYVLRKQRSALAPPEGFDQTVSLLSQNDNNAKLHAIALEARNSRRIIEYIFVANLKKPFRVADTARLERRYLPAPEISGMTITGTAGRFLERAGDTALILMQSAVYPARSVALVQMHLWLCLMLCSQDGADTPTAIELGEFIIPKKKADEAVLIPDYRISASINSTDITDPAAYLQAVIAAMHAQQRTWFDLELLQKKKLGKFAAADTAEILAVLNAQGDEMRPAAGDYLRRFYALAATDESVAFFDKFIRPVACLDEDKGGAEKKEVKRGRQ